MITNTNYMNQKIIVSEPENKTSGQISFTVLPIAVETDGTTEPKPCLIRLEGRMKIWVHANAEKTSYSLGLTLDDDDIPMLRSFEKVIRQHTSAKKESIKKLNKRINLNNCELAIIKADASKYYKLYSKLYTDKAGKINCRFNKPFHKTISDGTVKTMKTKINPHDYIGVPFMGSVVIKLRQVFLGNFTSTSSLIGFETGSFGLSFHPVFILEFYVHISNSQYTI